MHRIDTDTALPDSTFTEGDPMVPVPATEVSADWLNAVQAELAAVIEGVGIELDKADNTQLSKAIALFLVAHEAADPAHPASHISFDNAVAGLAGDPDRVQAAIEALLTRQATTDQMGLVELATADEAAALTDAKRPLTPATLGSLFGQSLSTSGYLRLPGGGLLQWGRTPSSSGSGSVTTTFPIAFEVVSGISVTPIRGNFSTVSIGMPTIVTGFDYYAWANDGTYMSGIQSIYLAIGR